jgi:sterol desaturase/sphingolipid hydroxylase (fatty acid hydroxylase superfamily)
MLKDIAFLFAAGMIIYDALTGRVSRRTGGHFSRQEYPIVFWIWTPILICIAAFLLLLALYDFYHRLSV